MRLSRNGSANERFYERYCVDFLTGCWNWEGPVNNTGYPVIAGLINGKRYVAPGRQMLAHRVSWIIHCGDIPSGQGHHGTVVMHKCDNRKCVNPEHLMLGTQSDNVLDMIAKGRRPVRDMPKGLDSPRSAFKNQSDIDLICSTVGQTKMLAEKFGVETSTIKRIRRRNGIIRPDAEKFLHKTLSPEAIEHIQSTKPGTRGLGKLYGVGKTTIAKIRKKADVL